MKKTTGKRETELLAKLPCERARCSLFRLIRKKGLLADVLDLLAERK